MCSAKWKLALVMSVLFLCCSRVCAQAPTISAMSPTSGAVGVSVLITGTNFGTTQGSSTILLNGSTAVVASWSATSIIAIVPTGATSGTFSVTVGGHTANSASFTVTALPSGWSDGDVGSVGVAGSASYANGTFTVKGSGQYIWDVADGFNFAYQPLSGDGTIVARVVSVQGSTYAQAGVMIRETLAAGSTSACPAYQANQNPPIKFFYRTSTGGSTSAPTTSGSLPYWLKVVRSGSTFSGYASSDGSNWVQIGTSQTISMAQNVYIGLAVSSDSNSTLATATFDSVSISPAPSITGLSGTTGSIGQQVEITGSNFGASETNSIVMLNNSLVPVSFWSNTAIVTTIPTGATSGPLQLFVGPSMNSSNSYYFTITSQPLPTEWLDQDIGNVGLRGSGTYSNGTFTVSAAGSQIWGTSDGFHFVYQPLSGDGTIVARLVSFPGSTSISQAGVMIRETLAPGSTNALVGGWPNNPPYMTGRGATGASSGGSGGSTMYQPYWVKLVRSGSTFSGYQSFDGVTWIQIGSSATISMATNVYVGLAVSSGSTTSSASANFDNVSITSAGDPSPVISTLSATTGPIGSQVVVSGSNFGSSQGSSIVTLNGSPVTINFWSSTSIVTTIPTAATFGPLLVFVGPDMNASNSFYFTITSQPLPSAWLDADIGQVGVIGSATYATDAFTVSGAGNGNAPADAFHFAYQPLSGDGTIVARLLSLQGSSSSQASVMIRENLGYGSTYASLTWITPQYTNILYRATTGAANSSQSGVPITPPCWLKLVRSGSTFSGYVSSDGVSWTQAGSSITVTMAQNVYIGLAVTNFSTTSLATARFDNVSLSSTSSPAPAISSVSATTGAVGSQVTITGSNFGNSQGSSLVTLNALPMTVNSWSGTSITITIAQGAASGILTVSIGPSMNDSNPVRFTVTTNPLPSGWLDQDIGTVGVTGSASYTNGTFSLAAGGNMIGNAADSFHFVYQSLSGDGTIVARLVNSQGVGYTQVGVMIRETLTTGSSHAFTYFQPQASSNFSDRPSTGGSTSYQSGPGVSSFPYWFKVTRSGSAFTGYMSPDGVYWTQVGSSVTISMATNVYIGLALTGNSTTTLATAAFDNVTVTAGTPTATPVVTGITPTSATVGTSVTVTGSNFGATQGTSSVRFNGAAATSITSWSATQVVALVPSTASTGPVTVVVNSTGSNKDYTLSFYNPVISSATPPSAEIGGYITLSGSGFGSTQGSSQVKFNGLNATISSWSATSVVAIVPTNATTGPVTVTEGGFTSNGVTFTVIEPLSVTSISPSVGAIGTTVTITGAGFGASQSNSVASFYGGAAIITSWSDTSIVAVVPAGASSGPVTVQVANITAQGPTFTLSSTVQLTDSLGNSSTYTSGVFGGEWYITDSTGSGCSTCTQRGVIHSQYDSFGNLLSRTDENGHITSYTYDANGNVLTVVQPAVQGTNPTTTYTYNGFGEVLTVTDPLGFVTTNTYDTHGNLLTVTTPRPNSNTAASVTQFAYNSLGQLTQITDPLNNVTTLTYTPAGLVNTVKDAQNNVTTYVYDNHGNRTSVTDALNHQTTFAYDTGDRLKTITYPDTTTTTFTYDTRGRRTSVTDQNGKTTTYGYDDADRLLTVTDAANNVTTYGYDTESNLTSIKDANNHTTSFTYDAFSRVSKTTFPSGYVETYNYDAVGNLLNKTDRKNQLITYTYDQLNRLTQKSYPDTSTVNYTYDLDSRLTQVTDPTGTYQFTFDNMGRLTQATTNYTFLTSRSFITGYSYDAASNRTGFTDPENGSTVYVYDTLNRLQTLTPPAAFTTGSFGFTYDALLRRTQMTRPNNLATNYTYDNLSRLLSVLHQSGSTTLDGASYTVDNAGNRKSKTDQRTAVTSNYSYDPIYELTQVTQATNTTESYTYDLVGNRLSSLGVSPYNVNSSNELTSTPSTSYTYDYNGNTLTKVTGSSTTTYAWDFENRMSSVTLPGSGGTVTFKYDPAGRRIQKVFTQGSTTTTTNYIYDGKGPNLIEEVDNNGNVTARYVHGLRLDEPLAELRSGTTSYYQMDGMGSATSLSSGAGALANTYTYDSFGKLTASSGSLTNPFRYTGREFDSETNLYFYRARYYDPSVGRFISEDPIQFKGGINFYNYVDGNPTNYRDPSGQIPVYGWWCGPNWTGGHFAPYDPSLDKNGYYKNPIDPTDAVCRDHDICYYSCRNTFPCQKGMRGECMRLCDVKLIYYMPTTGAGPIIGAAIDFFNEHPDVGKNDPGCPNCDANKSGHPGPGAPNRKW